MKQPIRGIFALKIARNFTAEETACHRVPRIAAQLRTAPLFVDIDEQITGVGTIERADGIAGLSNLHTRL